MSPSKGSFFAMERFSSRKYSILDCLETFPRIQSFLIIRSSSDISGVFGKGARVPNPLFFLYFRKKKLTNRLKSGILHLVSGGEGARAAAISTDPSSEFS